MRRNTDHVFRGALASKVMASGLAIGMILSLFGLAYDIVSGTSLPPAAAIVVVVTSAFPISLLVQLMRSRVVVTEKELVSYPLAPGRRLRVPLNAIEGVAVGPAESLLIPALCPVLETRTVPLEGGRLGVERIALTALVVWTGDRKNPALLHEVERLRSALGQ